MISDKLHVDCEDGDDGYIWDSARGYTQLVICFKVKYISAVYPWNRSQSDLSHYSSLESVIALSGEIGVG